MTEIFFYHLCKQPIERVLPALLEKSLERGWRVAIQVASEERLEALDSHLWTYRDDGFLPHGTDRDSEAARQPVLLTLGGANANGAQVRFLVDGAAMPVDSTEYRRIVFLFDGEDGEALSVARERWRAAKAAGFEVTYWQMDNRGSWQRQP